ncbi:cell division protein FtsQ/DivIB [Rubrivirga sp.]|uniref:cell division protein FtsQ/DivIB n=1 Tax=Rubrivirga sp. TaxID=1885344 RepID=UPI003C720A23
MAKRTLSKADRRKRQERRRRIARRVGIGVALLALGAAWAWQRTLPLTNVAVIGATHAPVEDVIDLVQVEPDSVALFSLSSALLADRAQRHPWVRTATVRRLPTGTLRIVLEERVPEVIVLEDGRPSHFLDAQGYAMPIEAATPALYDVPVLEGAPDYHPIQPVASAGLRSLLAALSRAEPSTHALVSEIDWRTATLWTTPTSGHETVAVTLGRFDHAAQLRRLRAFWDQAVLPQPHVTFASVDVRFDGQVVTREQSPSDSSSSPAPPLEDDSALQEAAATPSTPLGIITPSPTLP